MVRKFLVKSLYNCGRGFRERSHNLRDSNRSLGCKYLRGNKLKDKVGETWSWET